MAADRLLRVLYREHVKGNPRVREPLQRLAELDEMLAEDIDVRSPIVFAKGRRLQSEWVRDSELAYVELNYFA